MESSPAVSVRNLCHRYGTRLALQDVTFEVERGEVWGLLGPNGGGKTTLFKILSTLLPVQEGEAAILGADLRTARSTVRTRIGVTFQSPSLDRKLTVRENLVHQGHLYGMSGARLRGRIDELLTRLGVQDRSGDRVESLSGGLQRRVEIAKGLLHSPQLLLLDEPSTGLDPGARHDLWQYLTGVREETGVSILVTTHLMDEAERCGRLGILDQGRLVALGRPDELRAAVGGDCLTIHSSTPDQLAERITAKFGVATQRVGDLVRIERARGHELLREVVEAFPAEVESISLGKPTLEDVFIQRTGRRFWEATA